MENTETGAVEPFDWGNTGNRPFGLTEKQYKFCLGILEGQTQTAAARNAGYSGDDESMRQAGSLAAKSKKVRSAIAAYQNWQGRSDEVEGTLEELKGILWKAVRHPSTANERTQAAGLLKKIADEDAVRAQKVDVTPEAVIEGLGEVLDKANMERLLASLGMHPKGKHLADLEK